MRARRTQPDSLERLAPGRGAADSGMHSLDRLERLAGGQGLPAGSLDRLGCLAAGGQDARRRPGRGEGGPSDRANRNGGAATKIYFLKN
jgi:hypothetical protein